MLPHHVLCDACLVIPSQRPWMTEIISVLAGILKTSVVTIYKTIDTTLDNIKGVLAGIRPTSFVTIYKRIYNIHNIHTNIQYEGVLAGARPTSVDTSKKPRGNSGSAMYITTSKNHLINRTKQRNVENIYCFLSFGIAPSSLFVPSCSSWQTILLVCKNTLVVKIREWIKDILKIFI